MQEQLTQREQEIFDLLLKKVSSKEIGFTLSISHATVKFHQKNIYGKLGVNNIKELLAQYQPDGTEAPRAAPFKFPPLKRLLPAAAVAAALIVLVIALLVFFQKPDLAEQPFPADFKQTLNDNAPYGASYKFVPDVFEYEGKQYASPFKLGKGNRIVEGDIFLVTLFFTSDVDLDFVQGAFIDNAHAEDNYWIQLSPYMELKKNIKAGVETNITTKILAGETVSGTTFDENKFILTMGPDTKNSRL